MVACTDLARSGRYRIGQVQGQSTIPSLSHINKSKLTPDPKLNDPIEGLDGVGREARQERVGSAGTVIKIIKSEELIDVELFNYEARVSTNVIDALEALLICSTHNHRSLAL